MDAYSGVPSPRLLSIVRQIHSELGRFVESVKPIIWPDDDKADIPFDLMFSVDENDVKELTGYLIQHGPYPFANRVVAEWDALHNRVIAYNVIATRDWDDYAKALGECQRLGVVAPASSAEVGKCLRGLYTLCQVDAWQFQKTIGGLSEALPGIVGAEHDADSTDTKSPPKRTKRSTEKGDGQAKLIPALTKHHKYDNGSCMNREPVGCNELARMAGVSASTASAFFRDKFKGHRLYKAACANPPALVAALKLLNQEYSPHHLYGQKPPGEGDRDADE